jgi:outer membrane protein assembly factor BamB
MLAALALVHLVGDRSGQQKVLMSILVGVGWVMFLLLWLVLGSRLPWRTRFRVVLLLGLVGGALGASLEIQGVTGNLLPILGWKWTRVAPSETETAVAPGEAVGISFDGADLSYPRFLGPNGDATLAGPRLDDDWQNHPPREIWRRSIGEGWSAFAVSGGLAITQEQHGGEEQVVAYDLISGEPRWRHADRARYETTIGGVGPRATPTIVQRRVFTLGATGILNALSLQTGDRVWSRDILTDAAASNQEWGKSGSPLVWQGLVVVSAGGSDGRSMLAYDWDSGDLVWSGGDDRSGYSSPRLATLAGQEQILILNFSTVAAHAPLTGEVLWEYPWPHANPNVAQPLPISPDTLLVSTGYGIGSKLIRITRTGLGRFEPELVWESPRLKAKFANFVLYEGYVYGLDDGVLVCLDPTTGERRWKKGRYGHGQILLVGDRLLVLSEAGMLVLVRPQPRGLEELGSFQVLAGKTWNNPALAGPYLLVRNHREAALFELTVRGPRP